MMDIGTHVKVRMVAHIGRRSQTYGYKKGKIINYYKYGNFYLVDFGKYKGCYKPEELIKTGEKNGNIFQNNEKHSKNE